MTVMVPMPREKWTDERLDDLNKKVDDGFADTNAAIAETKAAIAETKSEMRQGFARVDGEIKELRRDMNARFEALNRNLIGGLFVVVAAVIGSNAL